MNRYYRASLAIALAALLLPGLALATALGPTGPAVQAWDIQPGKTYTLTISNVTECANGGTDATLNVRINSTDGGNIDLVATLVVPGTYQFNYTAPATITCTLPIFYCTTPGNASTGLFTRRSDGGAYQAHLRAATFGPGCTNPQEILGTDCGATKAQNSTWGRLKTIYR
jgi:hypothetical protein